MATGLPTFAVRHPRFGFIEPFCDVRVLVPGCGNRVEAVYPVNLPHPRSVRRYPRFQHVGSHTGRSRSWCEIAAEGRVRDLALNRRALMLE